MASLISAANAKIRSHPVSNYLCSTHFWGPASNFGLPVAAIMDMQKDPEIISGRMTATLTLYSATFMRYAMAVTPRNYLLFGCHFINTGSQLTQGYRFLQYWNFGGREKSLAEKAREGIHEAKEEAEGILKKGDEKGREAVSAGKGLIEETKDKVSR